MITILRRLANGIDALNEKIGAAVSWLNLALVLLVCFDVITRYLFSDTAAWINELEWHLFALIFLIGAGYTLKHDSHVRVDLFYANFSSKDKAIVNFIGSLLFLLPWAAVLIYFSYQYALESFNDRETSPDPGGLPARYLIKGALVLGLFLLFLQGLSNLIQSGLAIWKSEPSEIIEQES